MKKKKEKTLADYQKAQAKRNDYMRKWRESNREKLRKYNREFMRKYRAKKAVDNFIDKDKGKE